MDGAHIDIPNIMAQKDKAVMGLTKGVEGLFKKNKVQEHKLNVSLLFCCQYMVTIMIPMQVEYVKGWGKLKGAEEVEVALLEGGSTTLKAKSIIIATGSEVAPLPGIEIDEERCSAVLLRSTHSEMSADRVCYR